MNRIASLLSASLLVAAAALPALAQQLQRPATSPQPASPTTPATTPSTIPADPAQRARAAAPIPEAGPSTPARPAVQPVQPVPATPLPVRDTQGRIVPGAQPTTTGRARDPATGQEFQTAPTPKRPR